MRADVDSSFLSLGEGFPGTLFGKGKMEPGHRGNHRPDMGLGNGNGRLPMKNTMTYRSGSTSPPPAAGRLPFDDDDDRDASSPELPKFDYNNDRIHNDLLQEICSDIGIKDAMDLDFFDFDENDLNFDDKKLDENENTDCLDQVIPFGQSQERDGAAGYEPESRASKSLGYIASTGADISEGLALLSGQSSRAQSPNKKSPVDFDSLFPVNETPASSIPPGRRISPRSQSEDRLLERLTSPGASGADLTRRSSAADDSFVERPNSVPHYLDSPGRGRPRPNLASKSLPSLGGAAGAAQYSSSPMKGGLPGDILPQSPSHATQLPPPSPGFPPQSPGHVFPPASPARHNMPPMSPSLRTPQKSLGGKEMPRSVSVSSSCSQGSADFGASGGQGYHPGNKQLPPPSPGGTRHHPPHASGPHAMAKQAHFNAAQMSGTLDGVAPLPEGCHRAVNSPYDQGYHSVGSSTYTGSQYGSGSEQDKADTPPLSLETQSVNDKVNQYLDRSMPGYQRQNIYGGQAAHGKGPPGGMHPQGPGYMGQGHPVQPMGPTSRLMQPPSGPCGQYSTGDQFPLSGAQQGGEGFCQVPPSDMPTFYNPRSGSTPSSPKKQRMDMSGVGMSYQGPMMPRQQPPGPPMPQHHQPPGNAPNLPGPNAGPFDMQQLRGIPGASQTLRNPTTQPMKRRYDYKEPTPEPPVGPRQPRTRIARPNIPPHGLPIDPSQLPVFEGKQAFVQQLIMDRSHAFRSHPLFPLLRDLIIADLNFHTPEFPVQLIANLPSDFERLLQNYLQRNPRRCNQDLNPAIESVIMDALQYAHRTLIEKITERRRQMGDDGTGRVNSAIDDFCERFDQAVKNSMTKTPMASMQSRMTHANMASSNPLPMPTLPPVQNHPGNLPPSQNLPLNQRQNPHMAIMAQQSHRNLPPRQNPHMPNLPPQQNPHMGSMPPQQNPQMNLQQSQQSIYSTRPNNNDLITFGPPSGQPTDGQYGTSAPSPLPPGQGMPPHAMSSQTNMMPPRSQPYQPPPQGSMYVSRPVVPNCIPPEERASYKRPIPGKQMPPSSSPCAYSSAQNMNNSNAHVGDRTPSLPHPQVLDYRNQSSSGRRGSQDSLPDMDTKHFMTKEELPSPWPPARGPMEAVVKTENTPSCAASSDDDLICLGDNNKPGRGQVKSEVVSEGSPAAADTPSMLQPYPDTNSPAPAVTAPSTTAPTAPTCAQTSRPTVQPPVTSQAQGSMGRPELTVLTKRDQSSPVPQPLSSSGSDGSSEGRPERPNSNDSGQGKESQSRKHQILPKEAVAIMLEWLRAHEDNPYPKDEEKEWLMSRTQLTINQVNYWFTNARRRILPKWRLQRILEEQAKVQGQDPTKVKVTGSAQEIRAITNELLQGRTVDAFLAQAQTGMAGGHQGAMDPAHMGHQMDPMLHGPAADMPMGSYSNQQGYVPIRPAQNFHPGQMHGGMSPQPGLHPGPGMMGGQPPGVMTPPPGVMTPGQMGPTVSQGGTVSAEALGLFL